jgi:preprotein translocase subunit SecG
MYIATVIFHVFICLILMGVVLLQAGKGAEVGASFGGSSQTLFGSRGAAPFLSKITMGAAALYMITSLSLTVMTKEKSLLSSVPAPVPAATSTTPAVEATSTQKATEGAISTGTPAIPSAPAMQKSSGAPVVNPPSR